MSYHIYTTDGIILKRGIFGESNTLLYVLTEDLGLIIASARSTRVTASKLRGALQEYQHLTISCVKGKNGWKITNAKDIESFYFDYPDYSHKVLATISSLVLKMIQGESPQKEVFDTVLNSFKFLKEVVEEDIKNFEILSVTRILFRLGYIARDSIKDSSILSTEWNREVLEKVASEKIKLVELINKAIKESHL